MNDEQRSANSRRVAGNTLMLYFRMLLIMIVTLYTSRVVLAQLGVDGYGIYSVVGGIVVMFSFMTGAMSQSTQRFLAYEIGRGDEVRVGQTFSVSVNVHILITLIIIILAETVGLWFLNTQMTFGAGELPTARWVYQLSVASFCITVLQIPYNAAIIAREKMHIYAYISILEVLMKLGVAFALMLAPSGKLRLYAVLMFVVTLIVMLVYRWYCKVKFSECRYHRVNDKKLFRSLTSFAGWSMFGSFAWVCKHQGLNLLLNMFFTTAVNAAYGICMQVNNAVNSFVQNFTTALNPQIVKSYAAGERGYMETMVFRGAKVSFYLLLVFAVPILVTTPDLLKFWLKEVPPYTVIFTRLIIIVSLIDSFSFVMGSAIQATGRIRVYQILVSATVLLNIPGGWVLLKYFSMPPESVLVLSVFIAMMTFVERLLIMRHVIDGFSVMRFAKHVGLPVVAVLIVVRVLIYAGTEIVGNHHIHFIIVALLCMIGVLATVAMVGLTGSERRDLIKMIKSRLNGKRG